MRSTLASVRRLPLVKTRSVRPSSRARAAMSNRPLCKNGSPMSPNWTTGAMRPRAIWVRMASMSAGSMKPLGRVMASLGQKGQEKLQWLVSSMMTLSKEADMAGITVFCGVRPRPGSRPYTRRFPFS